MNRLARLARTILAIPHTCAHCGERTLHGHWVNQGEFSRSYWVCEPFIQRRDLTPNTTEPGGSTFGETSATRLRGGKSSA